jgi:Protein of unknown function (DUF3105)
MSLKTIVHDYKWVIIVFSAVIAVVGWLFYEATKPLPGSSLPDLGREHTNDISSASYNSNPPTSGTHFPLWAKRGMYDRILSDGYLIHSLEHGYIVISYDCTKEISNLKSQISNVYAQEVQVTSSDTELPVSSSEGVPFTRMIGTVEGRMSAFTPESAPPVEAELPAEFSSNSCNALKENLSKHLDSAERVIVVPRPNMDTPIAVTAWNRLLTLTTNDANEIKSFIETFHNRGPEKTAE